MIEDAETEYCVIWSTRAKHLESSGDFVELNSARAGGIYRITNSAKAQLKAISNFEPTKKVLLTNWLVKQRQSGIAKPVITSEVLEGVFDGLRISVSERVDRLLIWLSKNIPALGRNLPLGAYIQNFTASETLNELTNLLSADIGSLDDFETIEVLNLAGKSGLIEFVTKSGDAGGFVSLTFPGYQRIEFLEKQQPSNEQVFVAMWFDPTMDSIYLGGIKAGIEDAGYLALKIDGKEHNNKIDDEIIAEIRRSKFVVADFTSEVIRKVDLPNLAADKNIARGGVYFEAGFAIGLGKPVIWTVRQDVLSFVHFDTRQFAHIVWKDSEDLRSKLSRRISATLGDGPLKKPN
jgi:hypothetical protein